jgi:hypothetical protein
MPSIWAGVTCSEYALNEAESEETIFVRGYVLCNYVCLVVHKLSSSSSPMSNVPNANGTPARGELEKSCDVASNPFSD